MQDQPLVPRPKPPEITDPALRAVFDYFDTVLQGLQQGLGGQVALDMSPLAVEPSKRRPGLIVVADGVNWDAGEGEGAYVYTAAGTWSFLGNVPVDLTGYVNTTGSPTAGQYPRFTDADTVEARTVTQVRSDINAQQDLSGMSIAGVTPAIGDKVLLQDISAGDALAVATVAQILALVSQAFPPGHIFGLTLSNAAGDLTNDINIAVGSARSDDDAENMILAGALVKRIDATWAAGTNQGGLNTGSVANSTWYEMHLIKDVTNGLVDVMFTTTTNRNTLPSGYTKRRRIGWIRRGTATNLAFTQIGDRFHLNVSISDFSGATSATATTFTISVPPSVVALMRASLRATSAAVFVFINPVTIEADVSPAAGLASISVEGKSQTFADEGAITFPDTMSTQLEVQADASSQIRRDGDANGTLTLRTYGWVDVRGRMA